MTGPDLIIGGDLARACRIRRAGVRCAACSFVGKSGDVMYRIIGATSKSERETRYCGACARKMGKPLGGRS